MEHVVGRITNIFWDHMLGGRARYNFLFKFFYLLISLYIESYSGLFACVLIVFSDALAITLECTMCCAVLCLVTQLCPTLCSPMDCNLPGTSVCGNSPEKNTPVG